jgi:hypothetical protein
MDGDPANVVPRHLELSGMKTHADLEADVADAFGDCHPASDPPGRPIERGQEAVSGSVSLLGLLGFAILSIASLPTL